MIHERVEGGAHAKAGDGAGEEAREDEHVVAARRGVAGRDELEAVVEGHATECRERAAAQQVRPDIDALVVHVEERPQRAAVAAAVRPVPPQQKLVVAPPRRQVVPVQQPKQRLLDFGLDLLRRRRQGRRRGAATLAERLASDCGVVVGGSRLPARCLSVGHDAQPK